jgi:hypothetical protein
MKGGTNMEQYWQHIIDSLTVDDANILGILLDSDSTTRIKAMQNANLCDKSELSEARYRKVVAKLIALKFIDVANDKKQYSYFINDYGQQALHSIIAINHKEG